MQAKKLINKKLKSIYFEWIKNYQGPPPRSLADNFFEHLEYEYYDFSKDWLEKVLLECSIDSKEEFESQMLLIEKAYQEYSDEQQKKEKSIEKFFSRCEKEGMLPF